MLRIAVVLFCLLFALPVWATVPSFESAEAFDSDIAVSTDTFSATVGTHTDDVMIVSVHSYINTSTISTSTVTFNGDSATLIGEVAAACIAPGEYARTSTWILVNPDVGTHDLVVTFSAAVGAFVAVSRVYSDVDQTTPTSNVTATAINSIVCGGPSTDPATRTVVSGTNNLVLDAVTGYDDSSPYYTVGASQTERSGGRWGGTFSSLAYGVSDKAGAASTAMSEASSATASTLITHSYIGFSLNGTGGGGGGGSGWVPLSLLLLN